MKDTERHEQIRLTERTEKMAELIIEHTFEKTDNDGYKCTKEVNDTVTIDFLSSGYYAFRRADKETIELIPDNEGIFTPFWKYLDKDRYDIKFIQHLRKKRESHQVFITLDVIEKETGEPFYFTAYSPVLTEEEYSYFYNMYTEKYPDVKWLSLDESMARDITSYICETNTEAFFDSETAELIAEALTKNGRGRVSRPGFADFDCDKVEESAREAIKEGLRFLLGRVPWEEGQ